MKKLTLQSILFLFATLFVAGSMMSSCKKDKTTTAAVDKTVLADSIAVANALLASATEGVVNGDYQSGAKATLQTAIDEVQAIYDDASSTQSDIDNAIVYLNTAVVAFKAKVITPIAASNLVAQWTFDDSTGTTVKDASSNNLTGTFMVGHSTISGRGELPTWTTDRYGKANHALHFGHGAHIEVPFNTVLDPSEITISVWVKVDTIWASNYIISQNWWDGYKLNLQDGNKPFFTFENTSGTIYDRDWNVSGLPTAAWHHVTVTLADGVENYYADGSLVKSWTDVSGTIVSLSAPETFCIGQAEPNSPVVAAADDPAQWGVGYFIGSLDEIRIYNTALSATQVASIYDLEKVSSKK
jgi:hypothetical protein